MDIESDNEMKYLLLTLIIGIIPAFLYGANQDSTYQSFEQKIIQLEQQIESLEYQISEFESERDYFQDVIGYISIALIIVVALLIFIVPTDVRRRFKSHKKRVSNELQTIQNYMNELRYNLHIVSEGVNRAMFEIAKERKSFLSIVWSGRRLFDLLQLQDIQPDQIRIENMQVIIEDTYDILNSFDDNKLKNLALFPNLGGVKKNFQLLVGFDDQIISCEASKIFTIIIDTENKYRNSTITSNITTTQEDT